MRMFPSIIFIILHIKKIVLFYILWVKIIYNIFYSLHFIVYTYFNI